MEDDGRPLSQAPDRSARMQDGILGALRMRQFFICLQPKFELPGKRIVGAETLLRWNDPEEGILFPAEFLPAAEHAGYMEALDLYALEEASRCIRGWIDNQVPVVPISVNISAASLHAPGFCDAAVDCLSRFDVPPSGIEFEFSARFAQLHPAKLADMIECLHRYGFSCCIDGFSQKVEVSALDHLSAFEVDTVKYNCRACDNRQEECANSCASAFARAKELHIRMLCEGVERPQQLDTLYAAGCTLMQGYALSMPVSTGLFSRMLCR
ncbi:MAG: EAL domain-containing protein [Bacillota bacterium]